MGFNHPDRITFLATQPVLDAVPSSRRSLNAARNASQNAGNQNIDPVLGDPDAIFIRPPFTDFPGAASVKDGLTYNILAENPDWFLLVDDFLGPDAHRYPTQLEPPRGWCPKKAEQVTWPEGEEPQLRCTLCRRKYSGINAKSMWRRHVYEKHKIAMSNRRETGSGGRGRATNSEQSAFVLRSLYAQ
ncbi:uncharacterized protein BXZ73DRAFT_39621 [Epithele typhae]|uniref:uncharacterized protein n=1 Tax=Epithele typhae TaxID=378194 RepID=UPI0020071E5C|nr:uncharacterized protein BXZ73DRAFT_39621 [Epithele typhae]KAH9944114.1 hypothetical protein BXZ73DRAFT_39621 [Epithele typhae]